MAWKIIKIHAKRVPRVGSSKKDPVPIPEAQKRHPVPNLEAQKGALSSGTSPVYPSMEVPPPPPPGFIIRTVHCTRPMNKVQHLIH